MTDPDKVPPLRLNEHVASWLHEQADAFFDGDVERALNFHLADKMAKHRYWEGQGVDPFRPPTSPWDHLEANLPPVGSKRADKPVEGE